MSDTPQTPDPPPEAPEPPHPQVPPAPEPAPAPRPQVAIPTEPPRPGRFKRFARWMRDYESDAARQHYVKMGFRTSRIYAVLLIVAVVGVAFVAPRQPENYMLWFTIGWCIVVTHGYYWYQGKAITAYEAVQTDHADKDLMNSLVPAISLGILIAVWLLVKFFHAMGWMQFEFTYTVYGWVIILNGFLGVLYDLRVNTKTTLNLSRIPGRVEFRGQQH